MIIGVTHDQDGRVVQRLSVSTKVSIGLAEVVVRSIRVGSASPVETYASCWRTSPGSEHVPHSLLDTGVVDILRIPKAD